ncbi:MAG: pyridoxamine 5'-phosphate oxidase family protein [Gammaproteobacteria bacterium]
MSDVYPVTARNKTRQLREKAVYDREAVHAVLDACLVAQVGFVQDGSPVVVPMIYARDGETIYLHGARKARVIKLLEQTGTVCLNVTHVDGIVLARSAFNSSMNYRSATVFGRAELVDSPQRKIQAMKAISEHLMPGRWDELREPLEKEVKMTGVIAITIESASAKIAAGMPDDEDADYDTPVWAGVVPIKTTLGKLLDDDRLLPGAKPSGIVRALEGKIV